MYICFPLQLKEQDGKNDSQFCIITGFSTSFQFLYLTDLQTSNKDNDQHIV